jgi:hypothetical protein
MDHCDCCNRIARTPYHHDNHNPPYDSYDYCEACYNVGCDGPGDCSLRLETCETHAWKYSGDVRWCRLCGVSERSNLPEISSVDMEYVMKSLGVQEVANGDA